MKDADNQWIEIFAGGRHTDMTGRSHDGDRLIEKAVKTFDPAFHEPPATIGHAKDNKPAYAWVTGLKKGVRAGRSVLVCSVSGLGPGI